MKTAELATTPGGTTSGTLKDGKNYKVVIPVVSQQLVDQLNNEGVQVTGAPSGNGFGTTVLIYLIVFGLPILLFVWLFRRISKGAAGGLQGVMGVGRSRAKVFDEERPNTKFSDVAATRAPSPRSPRWWTSCGSRNATPGRARWCPAAS